MARKDEPFPKPPANEASPTEIQAGETKFIEQCSRCHALGPNITTDLRSDVVSAATVGQEPVVADAMEAFRQGVHQEAAD